MKELYTMKNRVSILSCALTLTLSNLASAESNIEGIWGGFGVQPDNNSAWTIKMNFSKGAYFIDYPSIPCGGKLKLLSKDGEKYTFREKITKNTRRCTDNGKLVVSKVDSNTLDWKWYYPSGKLSTHTQVKKYPSNEEYYSKVPALLEEYRSNQSQYSNSDAAELGVALGAAAVLGGLYWLFSGDSDTGTSSNYNSSNVTEKYYKCKLWCRTSGITGDRKNAGTVTVKAFPGMEYEQMTPQCESIFGSHWYQSSYSCEEL